MTAVAAALGSVIGYVGAEVAEDSIFERLLWPQRFYNTSSLSSLATNVLFEPMGGPLHRAALSTLDRFREKGLYRGRTKGHMLGTAFFEEQKEKYVNHSSGSNVSKEVRNGFWLEVLKLINQGSLSLSVPVEPGDIEDQPLSQNLRAVHPLFLLRLMSDKDPALGKSLSHSALELEITEENTTGRAVVGLVASELSAIGCAIAAGIWLKTYWLTVFFCVPLILKLLALAVSVRRESITFSENSPFVPAQQKLTVLEKPKLHDLVEKPNNGSTDAILPIKTKAEIFEIICPDLGFILIESEPAHILPFFRHYGYPKRATKLDRTREIVGLALVYTFALYFPAGLLSLLWMTPNTQYLWLGYQVYTIVAMHAARLSGLGASGRTEKGIASVLQAGKVVCFRSGSVRLRATLSVEEMNSHTAGRERIMNIVKGFGAGEEK